MFRLTRRWMISVVIALLAAPVLGMGGAESKTPRTPPPATEPARHPPDQDPSRSLGHRRRLCVSRSGSRSQRLP